MVLFLPLFVGPKLQKVKRGKDPVLYLLDPQRE